LQKGENINLDIIPDECYDQVIQIKSDFEEEFMCKKRKLENEYKTIVEQNYTNRDVIEAIKQSEYPSMLISIHAGIFFEKLVWKAL
jgi:hypothetical protein